MGNGTEKLLRVTHALKGQDAITQLELLCLRVYITTFVTFQELTRNFNTWKGALETLHKRGQALPSLRIDPDKYHQSTVLKALCSLETSDVSTRT